MDYVIAEKGHDYMNTRISGRMDSVVVEQGHEKIVTEATVNQYYLSYWMFSILEKRKTFCNHQLQWSRS